MNKLKLLSNYLFVIVLIFSSFVPLYNFSLMNEFISIMSKIVFVIIVVYSIFKKRIFNRFSLYVIFYFLLILISTYLNKFDLIYVYPVLMKTLSFVLLCDLMFSEFGLYAVKILSRVFFAFVIINFFQVLICPDILGYYNYSKLYLLATNYNQLGGFFVPAICLCYLSDYCFRKKFIKTFLCTICSLIIVVYCGSATSSIGLILLSIYLLLNSSIFKFVRLFPKAIFVLSVCLFLTFVVPIYVLFDMDIARSFLDYIGKDISFSGRTKIWEYSCVNIMNSLFIGYGYYDRDWALSSLHGVMPHNIVLQIFIHGGAIAFIYICYVLVKMILRVLNKQNRNVGNFILMIFSVYFLMLQFDVYSYVIMFFLITFLCMFNDCLCKRRVYD